MTYKPPPRSGWVLTLEKVKGSGRPRWRSQDGNRLFEWDGMHGEFEVYDARGWHLAVYDEDGGYLSGAVKGRRIDV